MIFFPFKKNTKECSLALDIGTEAVKALVFEKANKQYNIIGSALEYFDELRPFDNDKVILKAKEEAVKASGKSPKKLLLSFSPNILKSRVRAFIFNRKDPDKVISKKEAENITEAAIKEARKKITESLSKISGILPQDIEFIDSNILEIKIDGYEVPGLFGYRGGNLEFKVLASFLPAGYLKNFSDARIASPVKNLSILGIAEGIFIDIGGDVTQLCFIRNGKIEIIDEFEMGGKDFSAAISQRIGIRPVSARFFKERYSRSDLANDTRERTKEILSSSVKEWHSALKSKLKMMKGLAPSNFFIYGGGSQLPEIEELIMDDGKEVRFLSFSALAGKDIIDNTGCISSPQFTSSILLIYG